MIGPTIYIIACSARNRMNRRLRRLREGRYLIGGLVGVVYLFLTLAMRERAYQPGATRRRFSSPLLLPAVGAIGSAVGGVLLACASAAAWIMPFRSSLLEFSRAETSFLFPAPVTRRQLVVYRLMRSQVAVLVGALIVALAYPTGSLVARLRGLVSVWLILMTSRTFFTVVTLARSRLQRRDGPAAFAWLALGFSLGCVSLLGGALAVEITRSPLTTVGDVVDAVSRFAQAGIVGVVLTPFAWLLRPLFVESNGDFALALLGAASVYAVTIGWLVWADSVSTDVAEALSEAPAASGSRTRGYVARPAAWQLGTSGRPEWAFVWKGALQMFRTIDRRVFLRIVLVVGWIVAAALMATRARGVVLVAGVFSTWGALFAVLIAPQIVRMDMRQDLAHLELLKTWPLRGAAVLRGEIIWPSIVVTVMAWSFGAIAMAMSLVSLSRVPLGNRGAFWISFLIFLPGMVLAQYTIHNGIAVIFPGWVPIGPSRPRGVDAVGQRLIVLAATWIGLLVALAPGILLTAALFMLFGRTARMWVLPIGAIATTACVFVEMLLATRVLGRVYDRLDVTSVERPD